MPQRLVSDDVSVEELLSGDYAFSIPPYQRDFAWGKAEAMRLVDDVEAAISDQDRNGDDSAYFLGPIVLVSPPTQEVSPVKRGDVVDGQQRLVTLAILFSVLRDLETDAAEAAQLDAFLRLPPAAERGRTWQIEVRDRDQPFFETVILARGATAQTQPVAKAPDNAARANMEMVRQALRQWFLRQYADVARRRAFVAFLRRNVHLMRIVTDDLDYAYQIFLTINDRGKDLSVEDIFRGEVLGPLDSSQRARYEAVIDEMDKYFETAERTRSKGKTFFSHLAALYNWRGRGIIDGLRNAVMERGGPKRFVTEVFGPMAEAYLQVKGSPSAIPLPPEVDDRLEPLRWLEMHGDDDWVPAAMLTLARHHPEPGGLAALIGALDRFAHGLMAMGCGREGRRKHYRPLLKALMDLPPGGDPIPLFTLKSDDQKQIMKAIATRIHMIDPPTARLVLVRADMAITGRPPSYYRALLSSDRMATERFTVEHVCPKGELKGTDWLALFRSDSHRKASSQCIGNLVLITEAQNRRVNQHSYARKHAILFESQTPAPFALTEMLRGESTWDPSAIERRYDLVMRAIRDLWAFTPPVPKCPAAHGRGPLPPAT